MCLAGILDSSQLLCPKKPQMVSSNNICVKGPNMNTNILVLYDNCSCYLNLVFYVLFVFFRTKKIMSVTKDKMRHNYVREPSSHGASE